MDIWRRPPGGFTAQQLRRRRRRRIEVQLASLGVALLGLATVGGYRWVTTVEPVGPSRAVELFRAGQPELQVDGADPRTSDASAQAIANRRQRVKVPSTGRSHLQHAASSLSPAAEADPGTQPRDRDASRGRSPTKVHQTETAPPEGGVYSWATEGFEQVGGARREFPEETQRIITIRDDRTWTQQHYFSEERQIWTAFGLGRSGTQITEQRNTVTFGPVTRESEIDFSPPMLAAPHSLRAGLRWQGEWEGKTSGTYVSEVLERTVLEIDSKQVEVWRMTCLINLRGEQEGRVDAEIWFAPGPRLTVKEHYVQDVQSGGARYHAEWTQTLKSLRPRQ